MSYNKLLTLDSSKVKIWFTSDLHFGHRNIIKFCNRPWNNTEEMDEALINNWNSVVGGNDIVFDLGDFAFASNSRWRELIQRLKGKHYLILGNHDTSRYPGDKVMDLFEDVQSQMLIKIDNRYVYLNHYPFLCYGGTYRSLKDSVWQLFGHVHSSPNSSGKDFERLVNLFPYQYDVGVDNNNYIPVEWNEIKAIINSQVEKFK
jgi:calcineurin-like phosphoesterase family protein